MPNRVIELGDLIDVDGAGTSGQVLTRQADGTSAFADGGGGSGPHDHDGDYDPSGTAAAAVTAHEAAGDPHPGYLTEAEANAAYAALAHTHEGGTSGPGVVIPPPVTVDEGPPFTVTTTYQWGITPSGDAYYNAAGVTDGDEALLVIDGTDHYLRPLNA